MAAGVPEIEVPTAHQEAMPSPVSQAPGPGAFSGAHVGAGLGSAAHELFSVGLESYHLAADAFAQQKETEFQTGALKLRDQYKSLYNMDAIEAHDKFTAQMAEMRQKIEETIKSKRGAKIYNNNSLRNMRLVQESIDSHFEQQNRSHQFGEYRKGQDLDVGTVARFAADGNLGAASEKITMLQEAAKKFAGSHGLDPDTESALATRKAAHALIKTMVDARDPSAQAAYKQWGGDLDPSYQATVQKTMATQGVAAEVEQILVNLPRVDSDGKTNPRGQIDAAAQRKVTDALPADERGEQVRDKLSREVARINSDFKSAGEQMEGRVVRLGRGQGPNGLFAVPEGTTEWEEFRALYPIQAEKLAKESHSNLRKVVTEGRADEAHRNREAFGRAASRLYEASPEELKQITMESVASQMRSDGASDTSRGEALLAKVQKSGPDVVARRIPAVTREVLNSVNSKFARVNQWQAITYLHDLHEQKPEMTETQLGDDLSTKIAKGFFGRATLVTPERTQRAPAQKTVPSKQDEFDWDPITKKLVPVRR